MGCQDGRKAYWEYEILTCRICKVTGPKEDFHRNCSAGHAICDACYLEARRQADAGGHASVACPCGRRMG